MTLQQEIIVRAPLTAESSPFFRNRIEVFKHLFKWIQINSKDLPCKSAIMIFFFWK